MCVFICLEWKDKEIIRVFDVQRYLLLDFVFFDLIRYVVLDCGVEVGFKVGFKVGIFDSYEEVFVGLDYNLFL